MVTILSGLVGGLVATIVMTVVMMVLQNVSGQDNPTPTQLLWAKYVSSEPPEDAVIPGMLLHLLYGIIAGGVFVLLLPIAGVGLGTLVAALVWGLVWGVALFVVGAGFWMMMVLDVSPSMGMALPFLVVHLVYGLVLGGWLFYIPAF